MPDASSGPPESAPPEQRSAFLFDRVFYLAANPDLGVLAEDPDFDPEEHFWREGVWDGREPSAYYHVEHLQRVLKGPVSRAQALPLLFALGPDERPVPNAWFNPAFFRARYAAELLQQRALADFPLFEFYAANAGPLKLSPNALFDEAAYQERYPDVAARIAAGAVASGFQHFVTTGWHEGRVAVQGAWAGREPDEAGKRAERDALLRGGLATGMAAWFDEDFYLAVHRDVDAMRRAGTIRSGFEHFLLAGFAEGRAPHPGLVRLFRGKPEGTSLVAVLAGAPEGSERLALADAVALRAEALERGWSTDEPGLTELLWDLVEPAPLSGRFDAAGYLAANPDVAAMVAAGEWADAASHWRLRGRAENRLAPFSDLFAGRRASLREIGRSGAAVNYVGPLSLDTEAGGAARDMVAALEAAGITAAPVDVSGLLDPLARIDLVAPEALPHGFTLIDLPPAQILPLAGRFGTALFDRRMTIGLLPTAVPRPEWRGVLGAFDAILAAGEWSATALSGLTPRKVLAAARPLDLPRLRRLAQSARHPLLDRLRREREAGKRVVLFTLEAGEEAEAGGLDLFLDLARWVVGEASDGWLFCIKAAALGPATPGLAPHVAGAPVLLIDAPWSEAQMAALRATADLAVFPARAPGQERAALASIALGVPTLVSRHGDLAALLGADYPLGIAGRPRGAGWFEPDPASLEAGFAAHMASPRAFRPWPRRIAGRFSLAAIGPALRALLAAHCGFDSRLDGLGETLDRAGDQEFALLPRPGELRLGAAIAAGRAPLFTVVTPIAGASLHAELAAQEHGGWHCCLVGDSAAGREAEAVPERADARVTTAPDLDVALGAAPGAYLLFPAPGARLSPRLLAAYAERIRAEPALDLLYCDEQDQAGPGTPDWSPEHLLATFYPGRSLCIRAALLFRVGMPTGLASSGLHDLALRALAAGARVAHVAEPLYRSLPEPASPDAATIEALEAHLARIGLAGSAEPGTLPGTFRVRPELAAGRISAVILSGCERAPGAEGPVLHVERFLRSLLAHGTGGLSVAIDVVVDRGREPEVAHLPALGPGIRIVPFDPSPGGFNFAAKANAATRAATGETVVLLNDDMEALDDDWLRALLEPLELPGVGVVGAQLRYPDGSLQHAGIALGGREAAWHPYVGVAEGAPEGRAFVEVMRNSAAVTAACMAFRRSTFEQVGGFDPRFAVDYNDTDFCLRVLRTGRRIVYTPFARLRHHESQTVLRARADALERRAFERRWEALIHRDPYAPALSRGRERIGQNLARDAPATR